MDAEIADAAEEPREHAGGVLGVAFALLLIAGLAVFLGGTLRGGAADGEALLSELFPGAELPFGLTVTKAATLPFGERVVFLVNPDAPKDPEPEPEPAKPEGEAAAAGSEKPSEEPAPRAPEWTPPPEKEAGTPPREVRFVSYTRMTAREELEKLFALGGMSGPGSGGPPRGGGPPEGGGPQRGGPGGGGLLMDFGRLPWGTLEVRFVHQRRFLGKQGFRDTIRVNLSQPGSYVVLFASWPLGYPASTERVEEILAGLPPPAAPAAGSG